MVKSNLFNFARYVNLFAAIKENDDTGIFGALTKNFIILFSQGSNICLLSLLVEFLFNPFLDGEFLVNSFVKAKLIDFFRAILVETNARVFSQPKLILEFVVVSFSQIDFGNFNSSL